MSIFIRKESYRGPVRGIILDWAGTAVDHGCLGPVEPFRKAFRELDVDVSIGETRRFMGVQKKEHIRRMLELPDVASRWRSRHGKDADEKDLTRLYRITERAMVDSIADYSEPIPGLPGFVMSMRGRGIKIGSTTGYTEPMMKVLVAAAKKKGYEPDSVVNSSDVPAGRPYPYMCYLNAIQMQVYPFEAMVKIGDSVADIEEGLNAGMWSVGVTRTGNEMGLTADEVKSLDAVEREHRLNEIAARFKAAGAHYVVESAADCLPVIEDIEKRLARGELPGAQAS